MSRRLMLNLVLLVLAAVGGGSVAVVLFSHGATTLDRLIATGFLCFFLAMGASAISKLVRVEP